MKSRLIDLTISLTGKQRLTVELDGDFRKEFDKFHGVDCEISVKKYREKRSQSANAYAWALIDAIAAQLRISKTEVYRNAIRDIGGISEQVCVKNTGLDRLCKEWADRGIGWQYEELDSPFPGWTNVILYFGSSVYDTRQMATLIDSLIQEARALGIETRSEEYINSLLEAYDAEQNYRNGKINERS